MQHYLQTPSSYLPKYAAIHILNGPSSVAVTPGHLFVFTVPLGSVNSLRVYDESLTSMRVSWERVPGASGYVLKYRPINATVHIEEKEVRAGSHAHAYSAFPYPLYEACWQGPCQWFLTSRWQNARKLCFLLCCLGECVQKSDCWDPR